MLTLMVGGAMASSPGFDPQAVRSIVWARPFVLERAARYRHASPGREVTTGWLVELRVDPAAMVARQIGVPGLWIGGDLAVRTHWGDPNGCAVVWVPGQHDLRAERVFFGSDALPEQMDAERAAAEHERARLAGIEPLPAARILDVDLEPLKLPHESALLELAASRSARCAR